MAKQRSSGSFQPSKLLSERRILREASNGLGQDSASPIDYGVSAFLFAFQIDENVVDAVDIPTGVTKVIPLVMRHDSVQGSDGEPLGIAEIEIRGAADDSFVENINIAIGDLAREIKLAAAFGGIEYFLLKRKY